MSIYVDFHVLQTVPPSCVNRDDTGSPKTAVYGGSVRARVSSQAWKHAMRKEFRGMFAEDDLGNRTKNVVQLVAQEMQSIDASLDEKKCLKKASDALKAAGISLKAKKEEIEKFWGISIIGKPLHPQNADFFRKEAVPWPFPRALWTSSSPGTTSRTWWAPMST